MFVSDDCPDFMHSQLEPLCSSAEGNGKATDTALSPCLLPSQLKYSCQEGGDKVGVDSTKARGIKNKPLSCAACIVILGKAEESTAGNDADLTL